jgi:hypothetical protein
MPQQQQQQQLQLQQRTLAAVVSIDSDPYSSDSSSSADVIGDVAVCGVSLKDIFVQQQAPSITLAAAAVALPPDSSSASSNNGSDSHSSSEAGGVSQSIVFTDVAADVATAAATELELFVRASSILTDHIQGSIARQEAKHNQLSSVHSVLLLLQDCKLKLRNDGLVSAAEAVAHLQQQLQTAQDSNACTLSLSDAAVLEGWAVLQHERGAAARVELKQVHQLTVATVALLLLETLLLRSILIALLLAHTLTVVCAAAAIMILARMVMLKHYLLHIDSNDSHTSKHAVACATS